MSFSRDAEKGQCQERGCDNLVEMLVGSSHRYLSLNLCMGDMGDVRELSRLGSFAYRKGSAKA